MALGVKVFLKHRSFKALLVSLMLISGGSYVFMTGMVDRYYYLTAITMIMLLGYYPRLAVYVITSLVLFSINLVYTWGYPIIPIGAVWNNNLLIQLFSLLQTLTFIVVSKKLISQNLGRHA
jgi:hypothetical protein